MRIQSIRDVTAAVRGRRKDLGISQAELARRAGVSRKWIYELEGGKPTAEFGLLLRVLDELDLELELSARSSQPGSDRAGSIDLDALLDEYRGDG
jgi:HTH-type transcriptional regulator / antitoxin HipB